MGLLEVIKDVEKFAASLEAGDKEAFEEMLKDAQAYAGQANKIADLYAVKEFPLIFSILFAHHRKLTKVEKDLILKRH